MDRRVIIFFVFAVVCAALTPLADPQHRWVAEATSAAYVVLAALFALDSHVRNGSGIDETPTDGAGDDARQTVPRPQD